MTGKLATRGWWWGALLLAPVLACGVDDGGGAEGRPLAPGGAGGSDLVPPPVTHAPPLPLQVEVLGRELGAPRDVFDLSFDAGGGLWLASADGLFVRPPGEHFFDPITVADGLPRTEVAAVGGLAPGSAVVAFRGGAAPLLVRVDADGAIQVEALAANPLIRRVRTVDGAEGRIAVLASGAGIELLDGEGRLIGSRTLPGPSAALWDLALTPEGDAWVGDANRVARLEGPVTESLAGALEPVVDLVAGEDDDVVAVEVCPDGSVWASSLGNGVFRLSPDGAVGLHLTSEAVLPQDHVPALACDVDGSLWIGTSWGGLARRAPDGSFTYHAATAGLPGDSIRRLLVVPEADGGSTLWIASEGGVAAHRRQ